MSDHKQLRQGETPKTIRVRAFTSTGFPDLTTYTGLTFKMWGPSTIEGAAVGYADGYLEYTFTGTQLDVLGSYEAEFRGVRPNGQPATFPTATNLRITVIPA